MATEQRDYIITVHLRERFVQRTNKKFAHLQSCRSQQCYNCDALLLESKYEATSNKQALDEEIRRRLADSEEDRSYLNNTGFMEWYYQKYGYDKRFEFLVHEDILFVVVHDHGKKVVVTCVSSKTHLAGKCHLSRLKFNHVQTKEEKAIATQG